MTMEDLKLKSLLDSASQVPECPSDKFVAAFHAQMDLDITPKAANNTRRWQFGAIAASLAIGAGVFFSVQNANVVNQTTEPAIIATNDAASTDADQFAAQLVGYEDIETVVKLDDL